MVTITSVKSFRKFYLYIFSLTLFCLLMALATISLNYQASSLVGRIVMVLIGLILVWFAFYIVFIYYKRTPSIKVNEDVISFNSEVFHWKDLENIEMTGKRAFKFTGERKEGVLLKFKDQEEKYIFDDMYGNSPEIKRAIQNVVLGKSAPQIASNQKSNNHASEGFVYYKGFPLLCLEGLILWLFIGSVSYFVATEVISGLYKPTPVFAIFFALIFYVFFSSRLYYFGISGEYLIIRNHGFFWIKKVYPLNDIKEIVFELKFKMPTCLRVITNKFESKLYPAASLWSKRWMELKTDLEKKDIKVRNEGVSYEPVRFKLFD